MMYKLKLFLSYILCFLAAPKALVDAVNSAADPDELDEKVCLIAGVDYGKRKKKSDVA